MNDRVPAGDPAVMDLAEEHRQHTDRWYHDCGHEMHRQYAQAYLANDDDMAPGLAQYCHDAIPLGRWAGVAVQDLPLGAVDGGGAVRVQNDLPAPPVNANVMMKLTKKNA